MFVKFEYESSKSLLNLLLTETFCNVLSKIDQLSRGLWHRMESHRSTYPLAKIYGYATALGEAK